MIAPKPDVMGLWLGITGIALPGRHEIVSVNLARTSCSPKMERYIRGCIFLEALQEVLPKAWIRQRLA